jgi:hypothetical protein
MGVRHLALAVVVVARMAALAEPVGAIELGELQAVPSSYPPYIFRLALISSPRGSASLPAVTVRQPPDAICFVKDNRLELRLPALTDVELEVSQGGQTLNRLLLKSELQAARAQLGMTAPSRQQPAIAKGRDSPAVDAMPLVTATPDAPARALLEHELQGIRQEIHNLVERVTPWEGVSMPAWHREAAATLPLSSLLLGGLFIAGVTSLFTGYLMQRGAVDRARQRRRALVASLRRARGELPSGAPALPAVPMTQLSGDRQARSQPVTRMRRVWVSQRTRRRIRLRVPRRTYDASQEGAAQPTGLVARTPPPRPAAPAEFVAALGDLQRALLRLQHLLTSAATSKHPPSQRRPV